MPTSKIGDLDGLFKQIYGNKLNDLIPEGSTLFHSKEELLKIKVSKKFNNDLKELANEEDKE